MSPFRTTTSWVIGLVALSTLYGCSRTPQTVESSAPDVTVTHPVKQEEAKQLESKEAISAPDKTMACASGWIPTGLNTTV
jgi:hypothetical protein